MVTTLVIAVFMRVVSAACGLESIVPEEHAYIALHTVYENNVKRFQQGRMGACANVSAFALLITAHVCVYVLLACQVLSMGCDSMAVWTIVACRAARHAQPHFPHSRLFSLTGLDRDHIRARGWHATTGTCAGALTGPRILCIAVPRPHATSQEAFTTARGIIDTSYERVGYMFQTPEAWDQRGAYRHVQQLRS